jgi:hypothetical protein
MRISVNLRVNSGVRGVRAGERLLVASCDLGERVARLFREGPLDLRLHVRHLNLQP